MATTNQSINHCNKLKTASTALRSAEMAVEQTLKKAKILDKEKKKTEEMNAKVQADSKAGAREKEIALRAFHRETHNYAVAKHTYELKLKAYQSALAVFQTQKTRCEKAEAKQQRHCSGC